ncbi:histone acetyltransferase [Podospora fimiseda]|uniref:Histone acetyltransferase n=1 Tax=Podospora fimiseda TaxID=252190 RepID=A0AAN6YML8_9PEZI|nr:histone acetyltransferase [Podospora fimiseda]
MQIVVDDLSSPATRELLAIHLASMRTNSPPGTSFALDLSGLQKPEITVWTVRDGEDVLGVGALKTLSDRTGELKSMRTHPDHLRKGVARALLEHIIKEAKSRGMNRLSLETGNGPHFEAPLALYRKRGFVEGEAFSDYVVGGSGFNRFFHLDLVREDGSIDERLKMYMTG